MTDTPGTLEERARVITETRHLATVNLWRNPDNSLSYTFAEASGVAAELGDSGTPVYLCAVNALRAAVSPEAADEIASLRARVEAAEAENERLTKAVGSGILGELLNDEETDEFVNFIKFLRSQALMDTPVE